MCPHGYHHSGSMATPALGTRDVRDIYTGVVYPGDGRVCGDRHSVTQCVLFTVIYIYPYYIYTKILEV